MKELQEWHKDLGVEDFPQRFGISTNEKKFREISFRVKKGIPESEATVEDVVVNKQPIYGRNHMIVGYTITYRNWLPSEEGKFPGYVTIRFSLHVSVVAVVKVEDFIIAVEHDNTPIQSKTIGFPRMYGITGSEDLSELGRLILEKEYPFLIKHIKTSQVSQLGNTVFQDPSVRYEESLFLLIDLTLDKDINSKEGLADYLDHRNKEMLLHHIFHRSELKEILQKQMRLKEGDIISRDPGFTFRDQYSLWALALYFSP